MDHEAFLKGLNSAGIDYLVTGGLALNLHGLPRMSTDIDLVLEPASGNILKAVRHFRGLGYRPAQAMKPEEMAHPEVRRRWMEDGQRAMRFVLAEEDLTEVDLSLEAHLPYADLKGRAANVPLGGEEIAVMSIADLKSLKKVMGRPRDLEDLEGLKILEEMSRKGAGAHADDPRREQMTKFGHWSMEARCQWLLTTSQLQQQHSPDTARGRGSFRGKRGIKRKKIIGLNKPDLS
jgi:hypothetical protein